MSGRQCVDGGNSFQQCQSAQKACVASCPTS
jgi:hypothetical protein